MHPARAHLRASLADAHERVDATFSKFDLATANGASKFLTAHLVALRVLNDTFGCSHGIDYAATKSLVEQDLILLGRDTRNAPSFDGTFDASHGLGAAYVVAGSHFGKRVLLKLWSRSQDPRVLSAMNFIETDTLAQAWPDVMREIAGQYDTPEFEATMIGAKMTFAMFETAAHAQLTIPQKKNPCAGSSSSRNDQAA